jgi:ribose transport system substrate-binding protein
MVKKSVLAMLCLVVLFGLMLGCSSQKKVGTTVYVFGPTPDHGWTGSAARFAEEKIGQLNAAGGKFKYVFRSAGGPDAQIQQIEAMLAEKQLPAGVVIQASDNMVQAAVEKIAQANIPLIMFDRLLDETSPLIRDKQLIGMSADNYAIGAGAAYYMVQKGLTPGEAIWELPGDNSAVSVERGTGFREFLTGKRPFNDDQGVAHTIDAGKKWTDAQLSSITQSQVANWSRDNAKQYFESYIAGKTPQTMAKWLWTMDDEFVMGILELLQTPAKAAENRVFESSVKVLTGCGGLIALYDVMGRTKATAGNQLYQPDGMSIMSPTCRPGFFVDAIQFMDDYLSKGADLSKYYTDKAKKRYNEPPHLVDTASWAANKNNPSWRGFD